MNDQLEADLSRRFHSIYASEVYVSEHSSEASGIGSATHVFEYSGNAAKDGSGIGDGSKDNTMFFLGGTVHGYMETDVLRSLLFKPDTTVPSIKSFAGLIVFFTSC